VDLLASLRLPAISPCSPDEEAFLCASSSFGYKFVRRTHDSMTIRINKPAAQLPFERRAAIAPPNAPSGGSSIDGGAATEVIFRVLHILAYSQVSLQTKRGFCLP
jgi:hypothetical protein